MMGLIVGLLISNLSPNVTPYHRLTRTP